VESEEECCDRKCGIHIISFQVQERGTYFPSLQEVYPYAINKHVNIICHLETSVCCRYAFGWCHSVLGSNYIVAVIWRTHFRCSKYKVTVK